MPRILIKEVDKTSPGTPSSYANFSVLIPGFQKEFSEAEELAAKTALAEIESKEAEIIETTKDDEKNNLYKDLADLEDDLTDDARVIRNRKKYADANGVYEFTSAADFEDTIGLCAPKTETSSVMTDIDTGFREKVDITQYHYGNQMAYELLKLGYTVIYKPIKPENIDEVKKESFWEIFKDKASYDFRFITHGLLKTSEVSKPFNSNINKQTKISADLTILDEALAALKGILTQNDISEDSLENLDTNTRTEIETAYTGLKAEKLPGLYEYDLSKGDFSETQYANFLDEPSDDEPGEPGAFTKITGIIKELTTRRAELEAEAESVQKHLVDESFINTANGVIANLAKYNSDDTDKIPGRGDCVALIELLEDCYVNMISKKPEAQIVEAINKLSDINVDNGKYCALTVPSLVYKMSDNAMFDNNKKFPGAFHYLACFINSLGSGYAEWYAAAGYTRGVASLVVDHTTVSLGEIAINALEPRYVESEQDNPKFACNVIANFRGSYYLWGNRTAHTLGSKFAGKDLVASHFLNIRQLCITIKKQLYVACRRFTFDPNSDTLWFNFVNAIKPTLELMKADQGIRDYKITKLFTDKKAELKAKIRIIPIEAIEDFDLEISLEDSFGETTATITE